MLKLHPNFQPLESRREETVGQYVVVGNDSSASVCKIGDILPVRYAVHSVDCAYTEKQDAFAQAIEWARQNQ